MDQYYYILTFSVYINFNTVCIDVRTYFNFKLVLSKFLILQLLRY
jgi:hypothetical protein